MKSRVVIYRSSEPLADDELLAAVERLGGMPAATAAAALRKRTALFVEELDDAEARELAALAAEKGIEVEVEPMTPEGDKLEWLLGELPKWVRRGVVHPLSVAAIHRNYGLEPPAAPRVERPARDSNLLIRAVLAIGAALVGLGLILFIAANWQRIPPAVKIGGSLLLSIAALQGGERLRRPGGGHPRLGAVLLTLSLFGIGGVLILIAQVYHLVADTYLLPLVWGLLTLPVALFLDFRPALYLASGLWLWAYWLHAASHGELPWFYPVLLLGFLLPYSWRRRDSGLLLYSHLGVLLVALLSTLPTKDFWMASVWVVALAVVRLLDSRPLHEWLLAAGFLIWHGVFLLRFPEVPNVFYLLPLGYFFWRSLERRWNLLMIATSVNGVIWLLSLFWQLTERFDLEEPAFTGFLLWTVATGLLHYGAGQRLRGMAEWRLLSFFLRYAGTAAAGLAIYVLSFRFYGRETAFFTSPLFYGAAILFGIVGTALTFSSLRRGSGTATADGAPQATVPPRPGTLLLVGLSALCLAAALLTSPGSGLLVALVNLVLFAGALVLMVRGQRSGNLLWTHAGIALFVLLIVSRYFDTFVELLPRSVFFVLGGVFLIAWAVVVERQRRRRGTAEEDLGA